MALLLIGIAVGVAVRPTAGAAPNMAADGPRRDLVSAAWTPAFDGADAKLCEVVRTKPTLDVHVRANGGPESWPRLGTTLDAPSDWRRYDRLLVRMRLTSDDAGIRERGKRFCFCFYDRRTRHEVNGVHVQQTVARNVPAGVWRDVTVDLAGIERSAMERMDIYLYEMPHSYPHEYRVELERVELVGPPEDAPRFDGRPVTGPLVGLPRGPLETLATDDGVELDLADNGGVAAVRVAGEALVGPGLPGGVLVCDASTADPPVMVEGSVRRAGASLRQEAVVAGLKLAVSADLAVEGPIVRATVNVRNLSAVDRAVTAYFALPLADADWHWSPSILEDSRPLVAAAEHPALEEVAEVYPVSTMYVPGQGGLALAVPMAEARRHRFGFNARQRLFYVAFDIGLIDLTTVADRSLNEASVTVFLFRCAPAWGFRSAVARYYAFFPGLFAQRAPRHGGFEHPFNRDRDKLSAEHVLASANRFAWGEDPDGRWWRWNHENNVLNLIYIEPEFLQFSLGDHAAPTDADALARLERLAGEDDEEWARFKVLHYSRSCAGAVYARRHGARQFEKMRARACLASGVHDRNGKPVMNLGNRVHWIGDNGMGMMIPCNLSPDIPGGRGPLALELMALRGEDAEARGSVPFGGFALDCFLADGFVDYRQENFRYAPCPLTFDRETGQPCLPTGFASLAWVKELGRRIHPRGKIVMANLMGTFTKHAPYIDVFGVENAWVVDPAYHRTVAYRKPITYLPYTDQPKANVEFHLLYGIYPGRGLRPEVLERLAPVLDVLTAAGWEPVTHARAEPAGVRIERFGSGPALYVVLHNTGEALSSVQVAVDREALGLNLERAENLLSGRGVPITDGVFRLPFEKRETAVIKLR